MHPSTIEFSEWKPVTLSETKTFLALIFLISLIQNVDCMIIGQQMHI